MVMRDGEEGATLRARVGRQAAPFPRSRPEARAPSAAPLTSRVHVPLPLCLLFLFVLSLSLPLAACGPSADAYPFVRTERCPPDCDAGARDAGADGGRIDAGPPVVPPEPLEDWDETGAGPLTGIFAVEVVVQATVVVDVETRQLYRLRALQRDRSVRLLIQPCIIDLVTIPGVAELHLSDAAQAFASTRRIELMGDFLSAADPIGATFAPPAAFVLVGAELAMPETDPLPTMADPTGATDDDGDGNPGITIEADAVVCSGPEEAFAAIRASIALSGTLSDLDSIDGAADPVLEQSILGYTASCLSVAATLDVEVRPGSEFHARRVGDAQDLDDNGNVSCPEIAWWSPRFFGDYWLR